MKDALIFNVMVLLVVMEADFGKHRKIGWSRVVRPLATLAVAVAIFMKAVTTNGTGLTLELALAGAGVVLGLAVSALMKVYRSPGTHKPVSRAGWAYAGLWALVIGARITFSYGNVHWYGHQLGNWMTQHAVTGAALTDVLLFMAIAMVVTRSVALAVRARSLGPDDAHAEELSSQVMAPMR